MWYRIDFVKLVAHLLPPVLRSRVLMALLGVMVVPLRYLAEQFQVVKRGVDDRLNITANVQYLEKAMNDAFSLREGQIYIVTPEEKEEEFVRALFFASEHEELVHWFLELEDEENFYLYGREESRVSVNFIVMVPTFLCTSTTDREEDTYKWVYLNRIKDILKTYKPAGRMFGIELYDYE